MDLRTMTYTVTAGVTAGVAHVRFTRPEGANAMNSEFARDLREVMIEIDHDDAVRAIPVTDLDAGHGISGCSASCAGVWVSTYALG